MGPPRSGKTLLTRAVATLSGATFFNLSPRNTDGHYPGKSVSMLLHMVFKVARTMAPSVIWIDEAEKAFITDKKKLKEFGTKVRMMLGWPVAQRIVPAWSILTSLAHQ